MRLDSLRSRLVMRLDPWCSTMRLFATVVYCVLLDAVAFSSSVFVAFCCCYFAKTIRNAFSCDHIDFFCRIVSPPGVDDDVAHDDDHGIVTQQQRCKL